MAAQLARWEPENPLFWQQEGARVARRNLAVSVPALVLAFAVWTTWSVVVANLPQAGFRFTTNQLFWLAALPGVSGGTLRLLFAFAVPIIGGRTWTAVSTALLLVPALGLAVALQDPASGYPTLVALALACGIGGGNFASSMANISLLSPSGQQGAALRLNAGLGNLGVPLAQFIVPLAIGGALCGALCGPSVAWSGTVPSQPLWLQNAGLMWIPLIVALAFAAWYGMDDIGSLRASLAAQAVVLMRPHTWILSWLYLGSFGSFMGFSAGFPLLAETTLGAAGPSGCVFALPLGAVLARPLGGWLADRLGGDRVALWSFALMAASTGTLALVPNSVAGFIALYAVLFAASGLGNGAIFQLVPAVFERESRRAAPAEPAAQARAARQGVRESAASLGFASAIAAFGGFIIPKAYGTATAVLGDPRAALYLFLGFYVTCMAATWWFYARRGASAPR